MDYKTAVSEFINQIYTSRSGPYQMLQINGLARYEHAEPRTLFFPRFLERKADSISGYTDSCFFKIWKKDAHFEFVILPINLINNRPIPAEYYAHTVVNIRDDSFRLARYQNWAHLSAMLDSSSLSCV